ncbi:MAG: TA system VapC family ribonuclease toxin [Luteolibacter sp.]|uniref:TA system VapC family ribonuclease toxin n=1 Tax=Luteolibacter sp. TaxID=1962973 RepID=UPI0032630D41
MQASLFDSNIWVSVTFAGHPFHKPAKTELLRATRRNPVCITRAIEHSWLRLITTAAVQKSSGSPSFTNSDAIATLEFWLSNPRVTTIDEPPGTRALWLQLADRPTASPKVWMDAYLAAFAISGNLRFVTFDSDFSQYRNYGLELELLKPDI